MARAAFVTQRGAVGPVVYQGGRNGTIARERVVPVNPQTPSQQTARNILASVASQWRALTNGQRLAFKALAAQIAGNLTGFNAFVKVNATRIACSEAVLTTAPQPPSFGILSPISTEVDSVPTMNLSFTMTVAPDKFIVESTIPNSQGIENRNSEYRVLKVLAGATSVGGESVLTEYQAKFGNFVAGEGMNFRVTPVKNGIKGIPQSVVAVVAEG